MRPPKIGDMVKRPFGLSESATGIPMSSIKGGEPVSCMFMDRYLRRTQRFKWTPEHADQIIDLAMWKEKGSEEDGMPELGQIDNPEKIAKKQGMTEGFTRLSGGVCQSW